MNPPQASAGSGKRLTTCRHKVAAMVGSLLVLLIIVFAISRPQAVAQRKLVFDTNQSSTPLVVRAIPLVRTGPVSNVAEATDLAVNAANQAALREYGIQPFSRSNAPAAFDGQRWRWRQHVGYGKGDLEARVAITTNGMVDAAVHFLFYVAQAGEPGSPATKTVLSPLLREATPAGLYSASPYAGLIFVPGSVDDRSLHSPSDTAEFPMRTVKPVLRLEPRKATEGR